MIKLSKEQFDRGALVRGWNAVVVSDREHTAVKLLAALDVLVLGEKVEDPGAFAVIWSLYDEDTEQVAPVRLDATGELLRELEARGLAFKAVQ